VIRVQRDDTGASTVLVMGLMLLVSLIILPVATYAVTGVRDQKFTAQRVGQHAPSDALATVAPDSVYNVDAALKVAVNSVHGSPNDPCLGYPKSVLSTSVACYTPSVVPATQATSDSPASAYLTPTLVTTTLTPGQSIPSPVRKTVTSPVALLTVASAYECGVTGYPGMTTNITNGTTTSVVTMPAAATKFSQADVGNFIWIASNNGNCGQSGQAYRITAVSGSPTQLTISPKYTSNKTTVNWHMVQAIDPVITPTLSTDPSPNTCPSALFSASFTRVLPNPSPAVYLYDEVLTITPGYTGTYVSSYTCNVTFSVHGTDPSDSVEKDFPLIERNVINIAGLTSVYFTVAGGSPVTTLGKSGISYDKRAPSTIAVNSWVLDNR
jgi:hypothetical protein